MSPERRANRVTVAAQEGDQEAKTERALVNLMNVSHITTAIDCKKAKQKLRNRSNENAEGSMPNLWRIKLGPVLLARRWTRAAALKRRLKEQFRAAATKAKEMSGTERHSSSLRNSFYTDEQLVKRTALRTNESVLEILHVWWRTALETNDVIRTNEGTCLKDAYVAIQCRIYKAMMEDFDATDATTCAEEDWKRDTQGQESMGRDAFTDGLFELADLYTDTTDVQDYVNFLWLLLRTVAHSENGIMYFWKSIDDISVIPQMAKRQSLAPTGTGAGTGAGTSAGAGTTAAGFADASTNASTNPGGLWTAAGFADAGTNASMLSRASRVSRMERAVHAEASAPRGKDQKSGRAGKVATAAGSPKRTRQGGTGFGFSPRVAPMSYTDYTPSSHDYTHIHADAQARQDAIAELLALRRKMAAS